MVKQVILCHPVGPTWLISIS